MKGGIRIHGAFEKAHGLLGIIDVVGADGVFAIGVFEELRGGDDHVVRGLDVFTDRKGEDLVFTPFAGQGFITTRRELVARILAKKTRKRREGWAFGLFSREGACDGRRR